MIMNINKTLQINYKIVVYLKDDYLEISGHVNILW